MKRLKPNTSRKVQMLSVTDEIKATRNRLGYSQAKMAELIDLSRATYIASESGDRDWTFSELKKIAALAGLPENALMYSAAADVEEGRTEDPYKEVLLECIKFGSNDQRVPKTKLAKLIYLVDFSWYKNHQKPMTNAAYRKLPFGPVPHRFFRVIDEMYEDEIISIEFRGRAQLISLIDSSLTPTLSDEKLKHIKKICSQWKSESTRSIVEYTHAQTPWKSTSDGGLISYDLIRYDDIENAF